MYIVIATKPDTGYTYTFICNTDEMRITYIKSQIEKGRTKVRSVAVDAIPWMDVQ